MSKEPLPSNDDFKVEVATRYLESDSNPDEDRFVFAYTVTILNQSEIPA